MSARNPLIVRADICGFSARSSAEKVKCSVSCTVVLLIIEIVSLTSIPFSEGPQKAFTVIIDRICKSSSAVHGPLCHKVTVNMQCHLVQSGLCCSCTQVSKV